jgi:hypothetical protein
MAMFADHIKEGFFQLLNEKISINDFEEWVYEYSNQLEKELNPSVYLDLISLDYKTNDCFIKLHGIIFPLIDIREFNIWRTKILLTNIIEQRIDVLLGASELRKLYDATGEKFIPIHLGVYYDSSLSNLPKASEYSKWDKAVLEEQLKKIDGYKNDMIQDAKEFLNQLSRK